MYNMDLHEIYIYIYIGLDIMYVYNLYNVYLYNIYIYISVCKDLQK